MTRKEYIFNPYLTELDAKVLLSRKVKDEFQLILDRTIFYPDSAGGQTGDIGNINGIPVLRSEIDDDKIIHITKARIPGSEVKIQIDWSHRYDIMQQHTAQHLLSACFHVLYDAKTVGFHMNKDISVIDIEMDYMDDEIVRNIEDLANEIITYDFKVKSYFPKESELKEINFRKDPMVDHDLRVIEIDGFDYSACGGTHVSSTGELGLIKIISYEKHRGNHRLHVVAGKRALMDYSNKHNIIKKLNEKLSSNENNLLENLERKIEANSNLEAAYRELKYKTMEVLKENYLSRISEDNKSAIIIVRFDLLPFKDVNQFSKMFNELTHLTQIYYIENESRLNFYINIGADSPYDLEKIKAILKNEQDLRGGGDKNTLQGSININEEILPLELFQMTLLKSKK